MAGNRIKGITIEIEGNTTKLSESLRQVDKNLKDTQAQLKDVNKLLKLDPKNSELLRQKQELLTKAIGDTKDKLAQEKEALKQLESIENPTEEMVKQQDALRREIVDTEASLKNYNKQLQDIHPTLDKVAEVSGQVAEKTKVLSAAAGAGALAILGNAVHAAATADDMNTLARNTGFTVEELQKMQYASDRVDVSMDAMTGSVMKLTKNMSSGNSVFDELGVSITNADGSMRSATDVWYESIEALSKVENETERDALSMELFGKSAMELSGIIDDGGQALKDFGQEAEDAGLILSGETMQSANELNDQIDKLKATTTQALLKVGAELATTLAPALENIVEKIADVLSWFAQLDGTTQTVILAVLGLVAAISPLASIISAIATIIPVVTAAFAALSGPVGAVILVVGALVAAGVALYQNWDTVKAKAEELWNKITTVFENIKKTVSDAVENIKKAFNFEWSLPKIKLPHFHVSGGKAPWGFMGQGSLPTVTVDWYKKAYNQAMMFTRPTVLATAGGLKGFGDGNGSELVIGTNTLMSMIEASNETQTAELGRITALLQVIANNGMSVQLQGDARQMFKVVRQQNRQFTLATGKSGFDY